MPTPRQLAIITTTTTPERIVRLANERDRSRPGAPARALARGGTNRKSIPEGEMGRTFAYRALDHTLRSMVALARRAVGHQKTREAARQALAEAGISRQAAPREKARAVWAWTRRQIEYVPDPPGKELLQGPVSTLEGDRAGDCDEHSMIVAALLEEIGVETGFRAIAQRDPDTFNHVYGIFRAADGEWAGIDSTIPRPPSAQLHPSIRSKTIRLSDMSVRGSDDPMPRETGTSVDLGEASSGAESSPGFIGEDPWWMEDPANWEGWDENSEQAGSGTGTTDGGTGSVIRDVFDTIIKEVPDTIKALRGGGGGSGGGATGGGTPTTPAQPVGNVGAQQSTLLSTRNVVIGGLLAAGGAYYLSRDSDDS